MNIKNATRPLSRLGIEILQAFHVTLQDNWNIKSVSDPFTRLYYICASDGGVLRQGDKEIPLLPWHVYMVPSGCSFGYACNTLEKIYFHIRIRGTQQYDLLSSVPNICSMPFSEAEYATLKEDFYSEDCTRLFRVQATIGDTIAKLSKTDGFPAIPAKSYPLMVERALSYIHHNIRINLSAADIADELFVSVSTLRKLFKDEIGVNLGQYIDALVFAEAKVLLMDRSISIETISFRLGFCDRFYFSRRFKEKHGLTPAAYRRLIIPDHN